LRPAREGMRGRAAREFVHLYMHPVESIVTGVRLICNLCSAIDLARFCANHLVPGKYLSPESIAVLHSPIPPVDYCPGWALIGIDRSTRSAGMTRLLKIRR
jgi:hypothetical protein